MVKVINLGITLDKLKNSKTWDYGEYKLLSSDIRNFGARKADGDIDLAVAQRILDSNSNKALKQIKKDLDTQDILTIFEWSDLVNTRFVEGMQEVMEAQLSGMITDGNKEIKNGSSYEGQGVSTGSDISGLLTSGDRIYRSAEDAWLAYQLDKYSVEYDESTNTYSLIDEADATIKQVVAQVVLTQAQIDAIATDLKNDAAFQAKVKGEKGDPGGALTPDEQTKVDNLPDDTTHELAIANQDIAELQAKDAELENEMTAADTIFANELGLITGSPIDLGKWTANAASDVWETGDITGKLVDGKEYVFNIQTGGATPFVYKFFNDAAQTQPATFTAGAGNNKDIYKGGITYTLTVDGNKLGLNRQNGTAFWANKGERLSPNILEVAAKTLKQEVETLKSGGVFLGDIEPQTQNVIAELNTAFPSAKDGDHAEAITSVGSDIKYTTYTKAGTSWTKGSDKVIHLKGSAAVDITGKADKDLSNVNVGVNNAGKLLQVKADGGVEYVSKPKEYEYHTHTKYLPSNGNQNLVIPADEEIISWTGYAKRKDENGTGGIVSINDNEDQFGYGNNLSGKITRNGNTFNINNPFSSFRAGIRVFTRKEKK